MVPWIGIIGSDVVETALLFNVTNPSCGPSLTRLKVLQLFISSSFMENKYFGRNTTDEDQLCNQLIDGGIKYDLCT